MSTGVRKVPRAARGRSETGTYHVMARGIAQQEIFLAGEDRLFYLHLLKRMKSEHCLQFYAYCLMDNHVHLLLKEGQEPIGDSMRRIGISYAQWFNIKYGRSGYVFQGRFRSEAITDDNYLLTAIRYILVNPVKAGLCTEFAQYPWSSHHEYAGGVGRIPGLINTDLASGIIGDATKLQAFLQQSVYTDEEEKSDCLDIVNRASLSDTEVARRLIEVTTACGCSCSDLRMVERATQRKVLRLLKEMPGVRIRQIARVTGLSKGIVERA